jgi:hypothetical protein
VPAAVTEASLMADEHLAGAKWVTVQAARGRPGNPRPGCRVHKVAGGRIQEAYEADHAVAWTGRSDFWTGWICLLRRRRRCDLQHSNGERAMGFPLVDITVR